MASALRRAQGGPDRRQDPRLPAPRPLQSFEGTDATRLLVGALLLASLAACGRSPSEPARQDAQTAAPAPAAPQTGAPSAPAYTPQATQEALDRLRSLGYVGFSAPRPDLTGSGVVLRRPGSYEGYNFFVSPTICVAVLMDHAGRPVNVWQNKTCARRWASAEFTPSGDLLITGSYRAQRTLLMKLAWNGDIVWRHQYPAHHDVDPWPDGRLMTLTTARRPAKGKPNDPAILDNDLALLSPDGTEIERASLYELFTAAPDIAPLQPIGVHEEFNDIDYFHSNSVERVDPRKGLPDHPLYSPNNVLVCLRHQDRIVMVDWRTKRIVWAWGKGELSGPHDATVLPGGHILVFDNGLAQNRSRVLEIEPISGRIVWSYEAPPGKTFYTQTRGSNQRLPNGNTLIAESDSGRAFEVTPDGEIVWEFLNPLKNRKGERSVLYRMNRIESSVVEALVTKHGPGRVPPEIAEAFKE